MFKVIKWKASLRVANERKVTKLLKRYAAASGQRMTLLNCERCWKDRTLFQVEFTSPLYVETISEAIFLTLCTCNNLHLNWNVTGPFGYDDGLWEFRGYTMNYAQGIESVGFCINNFAEADTRNEFHG